MTEGFLFLPDTGGRVKWMDGEPGFWKSAIGGLGMKSASLISQRCTDCGFTEFFVDTAARPVVTLKAVDDENERLRNLVTRLQERVATLETIATDPGERTAREIDSLRALPDASNDASS
jgi:hypothetical protein